MLDRRDVCLFERWYQALLEFQPIGDEGFAGNRNPHIGIGQILLCAVMGKGEGGVRVVQTRRKTVRLEQHSFRHLLPPAVHGRSEDAKAQRALPQMCRYGEAVWTGPYDCNIRRGMTQGACSRKKMSWSVIRLV